MVNKELCDLFAKYPNSVIVISALIYGKEIVLFVGVAKKLVKFTSLEIDESKIIAFEFDKFSDCIRVCVEFKSYLFDE